MSKLTLLISLLAILGASFIFYKLSQIKVRNRCLIPLKYRVLASLAILLVVPAVILLGIAIAIMLAVGLVIALVFFIVNQLKRLRTSQ